MSWPVVALGEILTLKYGKALRAVDRTNSGYPVVGSSGVVGLHEKYLVEGPTIVVGRKGSIGSLTYLEQSCWPIDTTYFVVPDLNRADLRWLYWTLHSLELDGMNKSAAVPGLNRDDVYRLQLKVPPLEDQRRTAALLDAVEARRQNLLQQVSLNLELSAALRHKAFRGEL